MPCSSHVLSVWLLRSLWEKCKLALLLLNKTPWALSKLRWAVTSPHIRSKISLLIWNGPHPGLRGGFLLASKRSKRHRFNWVQLDQNAKWGWIICLSREKPFNPEVYYTALLKFESDLFQTRNVDHLKYKIIQRNARIRQLEEEVQDLRVRLSFG